MKSFCHSVTPDWGGLVRNLRREKTPDRVYNIELFLDGEIENAICERFDLLRYLDPNDPFFGNKRSIAIQRFLGYDFVRASLEGMFLPLKSSRTEDASSSLTRESGRWYLDEHKGPITNWEEFEKFSWPDPAKGTTIGIEWYQEHLPDDMCVILVGGIGHYCEYLTWLMGYETLCFALYDQRDLVEAIRDRLEVFFLDVWERMRQFDRIKIVWGSDDMGYRGGTLISPADMREFCLRGHKQLAQKAHEAGMPYILHSCGNLREIMDDLIDDVKIDARHSFEDTIELVTDAKKTHGHRLALLGGIDLDFLIRSDEEQIRKRVRETLDICMPGGGYCLGTGNSIANYIPLDNYLVMLDEGRRYSS